ncbi:hypothetical protein QR77_26080 [Streptomyces sp. 150FB]|uniref:hypothetical protein n=1 Tax=Streptomyces sp. 150FB TaxID=1576605 RepID=UPI0005892E30|nr:hypothetical protein [Streptomyces sp. 150FB]KIF76411.1 hypothetical protein QR77_26080 [Streptomyces sp. 150FB]
MSVTPRLLLTATAAAALLCGLCFVPSAHARDEQSGAHRPSVTSSDTSAAGSARNAPRPVPYAH